jgi:hypothetical protein
MSHACIMHMHVAAMLARQGLNAIPSPTDASCATKTPQVQVCHRSHQLPGCLRRLCCGLLRPVLASCYPLRSDELEHHHGCNHACCTSGYLQTPSQACLAERCLRRVAHLGTCPTCRFSNVCGCWGCGEAQEHPQMGSAAQRGIIVKVETLLHSEVSPLRLLVSYIPK